MAPNTPTAANPTTSIPNLEAAPVLWAPPAPVVWLADEPPVLEAVGADQVPLVVAVWKPEEAVPAVPRGTPLRVSDGERVVWEPWVPVADAEWEPDFEDDSEVETVTPASLQTSA